MFKGGPGARDGVWSKMVRRQGWLEVKDVQGSRTFRGQGRSGIRDSQRSTMAGGQGRGEDEVTTMAYQSKYQFKGKMLEKIVYLETALYRHTSSLCSVLVLL